MPGLTNQSFVTAEAAADTRMETSLVSGVLDQILDKLKLILTYLALMTDEELTHEDEVRQ